MNPDRKPLQQLAPLPGYHPEIGRWLSALKETRLRTKRALDGVTPVVLDWESPGGGNSIGTLLYHISAIEIDWLHTEIMEGKIWPTELEELFPYNVRDETGRLIKVRGEPLDDHLQRLDRIRKHFLDSMCEMSLDEFRRLRDFENYLVTPDWVIHHLMQHEEEHRGEIGKIVQEYRFISGSVPQ